MWQGVPVSQCVGVDLTGDGREAVGEGRRGGQGGGIICRDSLLPASASVGTAA